MATIAISYRRNDSLDITGRIHAALAASYGANEVFRDLEGMHEGLDFRDQIKKHMESCKVMLVIIGPNWSGPAGGPSRIENAADYVRIEVETGLRKGIPVIPVLVSGARMPGEAELPGDLNDPGSLKNLAFRHAMTVDSGKDFDHHVGGLTRAIDKHLDRNRTALLAAAALLAAVTVIRFFFFLGIVSGRGLGYWLSRDVLNYPELAFLLIGAPFVAYGTYKGYSWARNAGIATCAFGIFNGLYFYPGSGNIRLLFYAAMYAAALAIYLRFWKVPAGTTQRSK